MKVKRVLISVFGSLASIPAWFYLWVWILTPKNYESDGVTDFGYGFTILFLFIPASFIISIIALWNLTRMLEKHKNNRIKYER